MFITAASTLSVGIKFNGVSNLTEKVRQTHSSTQIFYIGRVKRGLLGITYPYEETECLFTITAHHQG